MSMRRRSPSVPAARRAGLIAAALLAALAAALLGGCGYALVGRGSTLPPEIRKVYIKPIENRTPRQTVDQVLTRAIADEMVKRQRFSLTASREGADAELSGAVVGFGATPVQFDQSGRATSYEISLTASIAFKRTDNNKVIWQNAAYNFRESYPLNITSAGYFDRENEAIQTAARHFAETMVSDLLEGF
ncbi:MAG TPA: LptE family protein [Thermoanaerobaculia bacterium]|nr:LptE family protein [Thermoanaerobaculia bacterium]